MRNLRAAVVFLTRVPVGLGPGDPPPLASAVGWFPVVGALVGAFGGGVYAAVWHVSTPGIAAVVSLAAVTLVTGAFHLDGLGDIADGFAGGSTPERRLEIMRDSRLGTYGVAAVVLVLVGQVVALSALGPLAGLCALVVAHSLGRSSAVVLMATTAAARADGLGIDYLRGLSRSASVGGSLVGVAIAVGLGGLAGAAAVGAAGVGALVIRRWARLAIGGISGDVLGGVEQVAEVLTLAVIASFVAEGAAFPWWT